MFRLRLVPPFVDDQRVVTAQVPVAGRASFSRMPSVITFTSVAVGGHVR